MLGIILAGGNGTRLMPLTQVTNKHLLPIYNKPMIFYPIELLKDMGLQNIILTTGKEFGGDFTDLLGDGSRFGVKFTYKVQEGALGIAHALSLTEDIVNNESMLVILGDNIFLFDKDERARIKEVVKSFTKNPNGAVIFLKEVEDANRFGVAELGDNNTIKNIEEKPQEPKSKLAVTGLYLYDNTVFKKIRGLKPSKRGELEITGVNNAYIKEGSLRYHIIKGEWADAGTFDSLHRANILARKNAEETPVPGA